MEVVPFRLHCTDSAQAARHGGRRMSDFPFSPPPPPRFRLTVRHWLVIAIIVAARLVRFAGVQSGDHVLDVACGTGVVAITAAIRGARVTGLDLTPELPEVARDNARVAALDIDWWEGDVESLPFPPDNFDIVISQFGHIFGPRPDVVVGEMLKGTDPGQLDAYRAEREALVTEYLQDNVVRQDYLMTRATKRWSRDS
jgi:ubiquinone/menaquinone biosynthesis C-methylase UbiE